MSAFLFGGIPGRLIELRKFGKIKPYLSSEIITELLRVLAYPKFELTEEEIQYLLYFEILPHCKVVQTESGSIIIKADPSDDKFLRYCAAAKAKVLISGDRHLLKLRKYKNTHILTPSQFLEKFRF